MADNDNQAREQTPVDPLAGIEPFVPDRDDNSGGARRPSPLAQERASEGAPGGDEYLLVQANQRLAELQEALDAERERRQALERQVAVLEAELNHARQHEQALEQERQARLELERRIGTLEFKAGRLDDLAAELNEERKERLGLERETATLKMEVEHARKLEQLLTEERQARTNAQLRASTAETRLAKLEGEQRTQRQPESGGSFLSRLRGG
ncbi:MAG: hypothetical protein R3300_13740 [Candidatus Promineifilaceae bacterium]|nr:hypothetical protein [Candidatus Promineifilaceae bacterium]